MELWKSESDIYIALKYPALHYILCVRIEIGEEAVQKKTD